MHVIEMKQFTIRGIDPELRAAIEAEAKRRGLSLNRCVIALLRMATGLEWPETVRDSPGVRYRDLDHLAGTWSEEEADGFDQELARQRAIDEDIWE